MSRKKRRDRFYRYGPTKLDNLELFMYHLVKEAMHGHTDEEELKILNRAEMTDEEVEEFEWERQLKKDEKRDKENEDG